MIVLLTSGDARENILRYNLSSVDIRPDVDRPAYGDPEVCTWSIQDAPCLIVLHDGKALLQYTDHDTLPTAAAFDALAAAAIAEYERNKVNPDA